MVRRTDIGTTLAVAGAAVASLGLLLAEPGLIAGHDIVFETVRLVEYQAALPDQIVPRLAPDLYHEYGSPIFVYYPPLFLMLTSLVDLLLRDPDRLARLLNHAERPLQMVFSGKAHPDDDEGKHYIQAVIKVAQAPELWDKVAFIEDYDMNVSRYVVQGTYLWLNNPR